MSKGKKAFIITTSAIVTVIIGLSIFLLVWFYADNYDDFYKRSTKEIAIPGLDEGFTPQGLSYIESSGSFVFSGYMNDSSMPSRIYVKSQESEKYVTLKDTDGSLFFGHMGGIAISGNDIYIASEDMLYRSSLNDLNNTENSKSIQIIDKVKLFCNTSFCFVEGEYLYVGEFYREQNYKTDPSHTLDTPSGAKHHALVGAFKIDTSKTGGVELLPEKILSIPDLVQGMSITSSGKIVLSTSYALPNSKLYVFDNVFTKEAQGEFFIEGNSVPIWFLEKINALEVIEAPCMSEELLYLNGKIYISFESGCQKYRLFVRERLENVFSFEIL